MDKFLRVLLADMNDDLRLSLAKCMEEAGDMELTEVAMTGPETLHLARKLEPDVLLLELILPELDGLGVLQEMGRWEKKPLIIIFTVFVTPVTVHAAMEAGAAYFLGKSCPVELIPQRIRAFSSVRTELPEKVTAPVVPSVSTDSDEIVVSQLLRELGVPAQVKGYQYLREAILSTLRDGGELQMVTKCLYPMIARQFSTKASRVERAIRHAIELSWCRGNPELLRRCFGNSVSANGRPTNSQFIAAVTELLLLKQDRSCRR